MICTIVMVFAFTLTDGTHRYQGVYTDKNGAKQMREKLPEIKKMFQEDREVQVKDVVIVDEKEFAPFDCKKGPSKK